MEPMYVDNVTTAIRALFEAFKENKTQNDMHFKTEMYKEGSEEYNFKIICSATSTVINSIFKTMVGREPRYLIIWLDNKKLLPSFPMDATREELMSLLRYIEPVLACLPISQQEEKEIRG